MLQRLSRAIRIIVLAALLIALALSSTPTRADTGANWTGTYYNNRDLAGSPVITRIDPALVFNWGPNSPAPGIASANWSARWVTVQYLNAGTYRFTVTVDDGVRMYIDGQSILDQWHDAAGVTYTVDAQVVTGNHIFQVDYYQGYGDSNLSVSWQYVQNTSTSWTAQYYNNPNLDGVPVITRFESGIDANWGLGSPDPSIPADYFSARWATTLPFSASTYRFTITVQDGVRLFIDNILVVDQWKQQPLTTYSIDVALSSGLHTLRVEYFAFTGNAQLKFDYSLAVGPPPYPGYSTDQWYGEYYSNPNLQGSPAFARNDGTSAINFSLSNNWPAPGFQHEAFSVRWTRQICFPGQPYVFYVTVDDGARFYIDTTLIIDSWKDQPVTTYAKNVDLTTGCHQLRLEYYNNRYQGQITLTWNPPNGQVPPFNPGGSSSPSGVSATVNTYALNVRTGPGVGFDIITQITRGTVEPVIARNPDTSWVEITNNGIGTGWISAFYVSLTGNSAGLPVSYGPSSGGQITGVRGQAYATVRVRSGPGTAYVQIDTLDWLSVVDIVGRDSTGNWLQVSYNGSMGWVSAAYVQVISGDISNVPITG